MKGRRNKNRPKRNPQFNKRSKSRRDVLATNRVISETSGDPLTSVDSTIFPNAASSSNRCQVQSEVHVDIITVSTARFALPVSGFPYPLHRRQIIEGAVWFPTLAATFCEECMRETIRQ